MKISNSKIKKLIKKSLMSEAASAYATKILVEKAVDVVMSSKSLSLPYRFVLNHMFGKKKKLSNQDFTKEELDWMKKKLEEKILSNGARILKIANMKKKGKQEKYEKASKNYNVTVKDGEKIKFSLDYKDYGWEGDKSKAFESLTGDMSWAWSNSIGASWWLYDPKTLECTLYKEKYDWNPNEDNVYTLEKVLKRDWSAVPHGVIEWAFRNLAKNLNEFDVEITLKLDKIAKDSKLVQHGYGGVRTNKKLKLPTNLSNKL